jgi:hypothetical protein
MAANEIKDVSIVIPASAQISNAAEKVHKKRIASGNFTYDSADGDYAQWDKHFGS